MLVPSFLMVSSLCFLFLRLASHFLGATFLSILALGAFLFAGGLGFCHWLEYDPRHNMALDFVFLCGPVVTEWSHPIVHYLFAHRPAQLSLCVVFSIFSLLAELEKSGAREMAVLGLLLGLLPGTQSQVAVLSLAYAVLFFVINPRLISRRIAVGAIAFAVIASVQLLQYFPKETYSPRNAEGPIWRPLSLRGVFFAPVKYWIDSLGVFAIVSILIAWFFISQDFARFYIPATLIWAFLNVRTMQPYARHSVLSFYPMWMPFAAVAFIMALRGLVEKAKGADWKGVVIGACSLVYAVAVASALLGLVRLARRSSEMWTEETQVVGDWIAAHTPKKAIFVGCPHDFNAVTTIAGKVLYHQTEKWDWVNGYVTGDKAGHVKRLLRDPDDQGIPERIGFIVSSKKCREWQLKGYTGSQWEAMYEYGNYTVWARKAVKQ
jgi:hypothetical protein